MQNYNLIRKILIFILGLNWLIALIKLIFGYFIKSVSMIADGFHSFSDGASNIVGLIGVSFAAKPADKEHLYGHKKYETFACVMIAVILFIIAFNVLLHAIQRLFKPLIPEVNIYSFIIMGITIIINIFVSKYEYQKGKKLNSDILISDSYHSRSDILTSILVIITLISVKLGFPLMDIFSSFLITFFIASLGLKILKESSRILCDTAIIETERIEKIVKGVNGVLGCHKIRTRGRQDDIHMDLHVLVKSDMHMDRAHCISYEIEDKIKKAFPKVTDIVVHMESPAKRKKYKKQED
ncbi:MAG: cation diffusion facilitator family transporter [Candidatus Omnitrophica bacterium]|nr:cation diffusion facilitator family transporter [Candidatus Omnitrophota bacterium]